MRDHDGRTDMWKVAIKRRADARRLFEGGKSHSSGAVYLAGYAVECKMKAIAMEVHGVTNLRALSAKRGLDDHAVYTHGLEALLELLPFEHLFRRSTVWRDFSSQVARWRPSWRYAPRDWTEEKAQAFLNAVDRVYKWLDVNRC